MTDYTHTYRSAFARTLRTTTVSLAWTIALVSTLTWAQTPAPDPAPQAEPEAAAESEAAPVSRPAQRLVFLGAENNAPYSYLDTHGDPAGYDVEVMEAVAEQMGQTIDVKLMPADKIEQAVLNGEAQGLIGKGLAPGRDDQESAQSQPNWTLCGPTAPREYRILVRKDMGWMRESQDLRIVNMLNGARVAVIQGDPVGVLFEGNKNVATTMADSAANGMRQVLTRRVLAFVADQDTLRYAAKKLGTTDVQMVGDSFYTMKDYGPAIPADADPALAGQLKKAVAALQADGSLARLRAAWFDYEMTPKSYWPQIMMVCGVVAGAAVLLLLAMAWRHTLRTSIARRTRKLHAENEVLRKQLHDLQGKGPETKGKARSDAEPQPPVAEAAPLGLAPMELNQLINTCNEKLAECVGEEIELSYQLAQDTPAVLADSERIQAMLLALCSNARDAIERQRRENPDVPHRVWIATRMAKPQEKPANIPDSEGTFVALSVRDAGCGVAPEMVQKVFQPGYTTKPDAAGRGLTSVYSIVAKHGGWIDVESAPGRGATFSIFLPAAEM